jgi:hypothetical protein
LTPSDAVLAVCAYDQNRANNGVVILGDVAEASSGLKLNVRTSRERTPRGGQVGTGEEA